jgi:putative transposase
VISVRITTDGHDAYPRAIRNGFGDRVTHRTNRYRNNQLEQDHRGIKPRYRPLYGFNIFDTAARFCRHFEEIRAFLRPCPGAINRSHACSDGTSIGSDWLK